MAIPVPALPELQLQRGRVRVFVVAEADLEVLHALVRSQQGVVGDFQGEGHLVGEDQGVGADDSVAGVESAGLLLYGEGKVSLASVT